MSVDEARQDLDSIGKIREKYKDDVKQLAKANLHIQRLYTKNSEELKAIKEAQPKVQQREVSHDDVVKLIDEGQLKINNKVATRGKIIAAYRENYSDIVTEETSDDAVLKLAVKEILDNYSKAQEKARHDLVLKAKDKREEILNSLPDDNKKYLSELRPLLSKVSDAGVMSDNFSVDTYIRYIKGSPEHYDKDVKEAEERGYKRGKEEAKIVQVKKTPGEGKSPKPKAKRTLTESQKQRALDMYGDNMSEQEAYDAYIDYLDSEKKK